jgi:hypothetical protein
MPHIHNPRSARRQHAVLEGIKVFAVDRGHEFACCETQEHARRDVVFADAVAELEILVEHGAEGKGDGLGDYVRDCGRGWG